MDAIALSKKNQKKIQKLVSKGQKKAVKANKKAKKLVKALPGKAEKAYKTHAPKDVQRVLERALAGKAPVKKKTPVVGIIAGVAAGVAVLGALGAFLNSALKGTDGFSEQE